MGAMRLPAMIAALRVFIVSGIAVSMIFFVVTYRAYNPWNFRELAAPFRRFIEQFAVVTAAL